jgi:hypothetical protein
MVSGADMADDAAGQHLLRRASGGVACHQHPVEKITSTTGIGRINLSERC